MNSPVASVTPLSTKRVIVCVAARTHTNNKVPIPLVTNGVRLWDEHMRMQAYRMASLKLIPDAFSVNWERGFLDNQGKFVNELDAWHVAVASGQLITSEEPRALTDRDLY